MSGSRASDIKLINMGNGIQYQGQIHRGLPHGFGETRNGEDIEYSGHWFQGQYHGKGAYCNLNGDIIKGTFEHGVIPGIATIQFVKDKSYYIGHVKDFKMHGKGKFVTSTGEEREGNWVDGQAHGHFTFYVPSDPIDEYVKVN